MYLLSIYSVTPPCPVLSDLDDAFQDLRQRCSGTQGQHDLSASVVDMRGILSCWVIAAGIAVAQLPPSAPVRLEHSSRMRLWYTAAD